MSINAITVYESTTFTQENLDSIDWEQNYFRWCHFDDSSIWATSVTSDFVGCSFKNLDWYAGLFCECNFIKCAFKDCVFRGTVFPGNLFVECRFTNCKFVKDNMAHDCEFERAIAYGCTIDGGEGFKAEIR